MNERRAELIYGQVLQRMDMTRETGDEELQELIRMTLEEASEKEYLPLNEKIELSRELFHAFRKLDILQELLEDPKITEIMVNGTDHIFYEKGGRLFRSERKFMSEERLVDVIQQIVGEANRYVSEASGIFYNPDLRSVKSSDIRIDRQQYKNEQAVIQEWIGGDTKMDHSCNSRSRRENYVKCR